MQAPPPPMMSAPMTMDRRRMLVAASIVFGLFLLFVGAILINLSNAAHGTETPDQMNARLNLGLVWGPAVAHIGMFFFIVGIIGAAMFLEELDIFVRLFLLIVAFVALLLILAKSPTIFG
jgi:hypothetical protein